MPVYARVLLLTAFLCTGCHTVCPSILCGTELRQIRTVSPPRIHDMPGLRGHGTGETIAPVFRTAWHDARLIPFVPSALSGADPAHVKVDVLLEECGLTKRHEYETQVGGNLVQRIVHRAVEKHRNAPHYVVALVVRITREPNKALVYQCAARGESTRGILHAAQEACKQALAPLRRYLRERPH